MRLGIFSALVALLLAGCAHKPLVVANDQELAAAVATLDYPNTSILIAAGDIARCRSIEGAAATARVVSALVARFPNARVITLGDHTYPRGRQREFEECYAPTWGVHNARTAPTPGNHEYRTADAAPYFDYFDLYRRDPQARERGYYHFDFGSWRIFSLNSSLPIAHGSPQNEWLDAELAGAGSRCVLAYWHHPLFSSGFHGKQRRDPGRDTWPLWQTLASRGADVVVNGHTHMYERFAPATVDGGTSPDGLLQFVVGTGGASHNRARRTLPISRYVNDDTFGVLVLALGADSFRWAFVGIDGVIRDRSDAPTAC